MALLTTAGHCEYYVYLIRGRRKLNSYIMYTMLLIRDLQQEVGWLSKVDQKEMIRYHLTQVNHTYA